MHCYSQHASALRAELTAALPKDLLRALQRALIPFYERRQMRWHNYSGLVYGWLGRPTPAGKRDAGE